MTILIIIVIYIISFICPSVKRQLENDCTQSASVGHNLNIYALFLKMLDLILLLSCFKIFIMGD